MAINCKPRKVAYEVLRVTANESNYGPFCIYRAGENEWRSGFRNDELTEYEKKHKTLNEALSFIDSNIGNLKAKYPDKIW